jgi:hypothetical protein
MAQASLTEDVMRATLDAVEIHGDQSAAARATGIPLNTFRSRYRRAVEMLGKEAAPKKKDFEAPALPDELPTADELLERRKKAFSRKKEAKDARALVPIKINVDGPFGIAHFGDPHVDDDGTDLSLLERHVAIINDTEALLAANVGDYSNNWVGRLARLYGEQSLSAAEAWVLVEWLVRALPWAWMVGGNHDVWSGAGDPIQWMSRQSNSLYQHHGLRIGLNCPNGRTIRVNARHDFKGHSMWNTTHGPAKAVQMGWRDHILTCGHTHVSGYQVLKDPASGLLSHALRVGSYKSYDRYAEEKGLPNQCFTVCPVTLIDPRWPDDDPRLVQVFFDPEPAAEYLTWLRKKWARGSTAA